MAEADSPSSDFLTDNGSADDPHRQFMTRALQLAQAGEGFVEPNPMVGCVIVRDGQKIGEGYHHAFGQPHAEIEALRSVRDPGQIAGSTAYVTLEPCCHFGKTPPCSQALIDSKVARVVVAMRDPFPKVDGGGLRQLQQAGIETIVGVMEQEAKSLNAPYLKRLQTGRPWVIAKWAVSADGRIATSTGESQWITGPSARQAVHRLRSRVDAIAVGMGTVQADDPRLTARLPADESPRRVASRLVFCRRRLPTASSQLVRSARDVPLTLLISRRLLESGGGAAKETINTLRDQGVEVFRVTDDAPGQMIHASLEEAGRRQMTNLMLEGGAELLASFFEADAIDEYHIYIGAKVIGGKLAPGPISGVGMTQINEARALSLRATDRFENDVRIIYRCQGA